MRVRVLNSLLVAGVLGLIGAMPARGAIIISSASRSLATDGTYATPASNSSTSTGVYNQSVSSSGSGAAATSLNTYAAQNSTVPASASSVMSGQGQVSTIIDATGFADFDELARSTFDVTFQIDFAGTSTFQASADWYGYTDPQHGYSRVELLDVTHSTTVASVIATDIDFVPPAFNAPVTLTPGVTYRLKAENLFYGVGNEYTGITGQANWSFTLTSVPEPTSLGLLAIGSAALMRRRCVR